MVAADVGARVAAKAPARDAGRSNAVATSDTPFVRGDRYRGHYWCAQGRTELTLVIEDTDDADGNGLEVIFEFDFPGSALYPAAVGSYRMRGTWDPRVRSLRLKGERWIDQPGGYLMVDLAGTVSASGAISGRVTGAPQCSTFTVTPDGPREGARGP
jgi:hypothetical protein